MSSESASVNTKRINAGAVFVFITVNAETDDGDALPPELPPPDSPLIRAPSPALQPVMVAGPVAAAVSRR